MRIMAASILFGLSVGISGIMATDPSDAGRGYLGVGLADAPQGAPAAAMVGGGQAEVRYVRYADPA